MIPEEIQLLISEIVSRRVLVFHNGNAIGILEVSLNLPNPKSPSSNSSEVYFNENFFRNVSIIYDGICMNFYCTPLANFPKNPDEIHGVISEETRGLVPSLIL